MLLSDIKTKTHSGPSPSDSQGVAGALARAGRPLTPLVGQAGVLGPAEGPVAGPQAVGLLVGLLGAEAPVAGDLEHLGLLEHPARGLPVVGAGRGALPPRRRRGVWGRRWRRRRWGRRRRTWRRRRGRRLGGRGRGEGGAGLLAQRASRRQASPSPREPLAAHGVGLGEGGGVPLAPRPAPAGVPSDPALLLLPPVGRALD